MVPYHTIGRVAPTVLSLDSRNGGNNIVNSNIGRHRTGAFAQNTQNDPLGYNES